MGLEEEIIQRLLYLSLKVVPLIVAAVFFSNLLMEFGVIKRLDFLVRPLIRAARLPEGTGAVIITSMGSATASYAMLANHHQKGEMDEDQVIVTSIMNTFFMTVHHFFSYYVPVVVPLLGLYTGLLYGGIKVAIGLCMTLSAVVIGRLRLGEPGEVPLGQGADHTGEGGSTRVRHAAAGSFKTLGMVLPRLYVVYAAAVVLLAGGYMDSLGALAEPLARVFGLPGEAVAIMALQLLDATSGFVLAGALLEDGTLGPIQAITALLLGTVITLSMTYAKHSLPSKIAFFGPKLGTKIALYNLVLHLAFTAAALGLLVAVS
ncbi:MAG: hypothetical protein GXO65_04925 [Euryarchaeota archaeon]|nr:hypothetical protein [Euryarchaeota archaeon]